MSFSNPSAIILMAAGHILKLSDEAIANWDGGSADKLDAIMQEFAQSADVFLKKAKSIKITHIDFKDE